MPCSVCGQTCVKSSTGGVLLWERNGFISAICENCWNQYSTKKPEERCCQNEFQLAALMANVGVETQLFHKDMNPHKPFVENVAEARSKLHYPIQRNPVYSNKL